MSRRISTFFGRSKEAPPTTNSQAPPPIPSPSALAQPSAGQSGGQIWGVTASQGLSPYSAGMPAHQSRSTPDLSRLDLEEREVDDVPRWPLGSDAQGRILPTGNGTMSSRPGSRAGTLSEAAAARKPSVPQDSLAPPTPPFAPRPDRRSSLVPTLDGGSRPGSRAGTGSQGTPSRPVTPSLLMPSAPGSQGSGSRPGTPTEGKLQKQKKRASWLPGRSRSPSQSQAADGRERFPAWIGGLAGKVQYDVEPLVNSQPVRITLLHMRDTRY